MTELAAPRRLHLRIAVDDPSLLPFEESRRARDARPPDPTRDFREARLDEVLSLDLDGATLTIDPSFFCDMRCTFCDLPVTSRLGVDMESLRLPIRALALAGVRRAAIIGGEPGLWPALPELVSELSRHGMHVALFTHGAWAARAQRLERLLECGLSEVVMSVKGLDEETSFAVTRRKNRHERQRLAAMELAEAWRTKRLRALTMNHVITRTTLAGLAGLPEWLAKLPAVPALALTLIEAYEDDAIRFVPAPDELRVALPPVFAELDARGVDWSVEGVPFCVLGDHWHRSRDVVKATDRATRIQIKPLADGDYLLAYRGYQRLLQFAQRDGCAGCGKSEACPGVHKRLVATWRDDALVPFPLERRS